MAANTKKGEAIHVHVAPKATDEIGSRTRCPIARSIREQEPDVISSTIDVSEMFINVSRRSTGKRHTYNSPPAAKAFIQAFEHTTGFTTPPFDLLVTDEDEVLTLRKPIQQITPEQRKHNQAVALTRKVGPQAQRLSAALKQAQPAKMARQPRGRHTTPPAKARRAKLAA